MSAQTKDQRMVLLSQMPEGVRRVAVLGPSGATCYKRPDELDLDNDEILLNSSGVPIVMKRSPGRKKRTKLVPATPQAAKSVEARLDHLSQDTLLSQAASNAAGDGVLNAIMRGMAEEAAQIEFDRYEAANKGEDTSHLAARRARVLKAMADTWLKRKQQTEGGLVDLDSPVFHALFSLILKTFKEAMVDAGTRAEHIETIFAKLVTAVQEDTWKQDAVARMKEKMG
jgi:hypothetical protein